MSPGTSLASFGSLATFLADRRPEHPLTIGLDGARSPNPEEASIP
jgi:hypothetical protein